MTKAPEILLPHGTEYVTVGDIPNLIAHALYPEPAERRVSYLRKVVRGSSRTVELTKEDWKYLAKVWAHLLPYSDGMPESQWAAYSAAFTTAADGLDWMLVPFEKDGPYAMAMMRADAENLHKKALEDAIRSGSLVARTHALTEASPWDGVLPTARILVGDLIQYCAGVPVNIRFESAHQIALRRAAVHRSTVGSVARALASDMVTLHSGSSSANDGVRDDIRAAILETQILADIQKLSDKGLISPRTDDRGTRAVRPCAVDKAWRLTRRDLEVVSEYAKRDENSKRDYLEELARYQISGRYTLMQAADFIESEGGEDYKAMLERLTVAARNDELPMYLPGRNQRLDYGPKPRAKPCVRVFYEEAYWNDLNTWLGQYEPRITCRFPDPRHPPQNGSPAIATPTENWNDERRAEAFEPRNAGSDHPLQRQAHQELEILRVISELGHDPLALPKTHGVAGVKAEVRKRLNYSEEVVNKAWKRLRKARRIADRR
jgi:hypothetical protein